MSRNYLGKRRRFSSNRFRRGGMSSRIRSIAKRTIYKMAEVKYTFDYSFYFMDPIVDGYMLYPATPSIDLGFLKDERIGNRMKYKMISINAALTIQRGPDVANNAAQSDQFYCRIALIQGRSCTLPPALDEIVDLEAFANIKQVYNRLSYTGFRPNQVRVLQDEQFCLQATRNTAGTVINVGSGGTPTMVNFRMRHKIHNNVNLDSDKTISSEPKDNYYLYVACWPASGPTYDVSGNTWTMTGVYTARCPIYCRISYTDV